MNYPWSKTVFPIAAIFSFRLLGLAALIPVFSLYAGHLQGANAVLVGFALGAYGLTQSLFQIPFGMLSDKWARKPVITLGLILFALGSLLGIFAHSIQMMILARILQGSGAIGSVLIALLADLTREEERTQAMAVIGVSIALSFSLAMVISPLITERFGMSGVFTLIMILALVALVLLHKVIPTPKKERFHEESEANAWLLKIVLQNKKLQRLNFGIFSQHFILTSTFFAIPLILNEQMKQGNLTQQSLFYFCLILFSFVLMVPCIILAERKKRFKTVFFAAILCIILSQALLALTYSNWYSLCALMFLYFVPFNVLEALLPSLVSKEASVHSKGTAMGIYSSAQFFGLFAGGALAGIVFHWSGSQGIFLLNALLGCIWLLVLY